ncbi:amino acid ABC transporter substrate-binding protein [Parasporobacterium paucivorans]|uniref:Amino acid ABC transporter substrate-binding protein, PAAT family n=1 Tax=Parasporobacterium paucivorans DSM 15970 TaxID=1122934 RepID=A0A1M6D5X7_9FIRM|nr:amino acid ABC transporter substrate-binding protein [Parasporobacterium paucivorans]SHI68524.1 amino acid ABC transporter substrate-binding protein, PAAT family [Parasporobacterium paucivorans DSM 15970]
MKKKIFAITLTLALAFGLTACGSGTQQAETTTTAAAERTQLVVGFDAEYPPYGYMDDKGEYTGFDLEMAQAVCDLRGWELVKTPIDWASKDMELDSGAIDCIWNGFTINGREDDYTWSVPYIDNSQVIVTAKDSGISTLADLKGKNVGVQSASAALNVLNGDQSAVKDTFASLTEYGDYNTAFTELQAGAIDAIAMDIGVAQYQISSRGEGYVIIDEILAAEQYGIGFKLGNTELKDQVEESLMQLVANGTYATLAEKYGLTDYIILEAE